MTGSPWTNPAVVAAFLSAVAAIAAAIATWRGPITAARMSERLRRQGESEMESRRFRLNIFAFIMQGRAEIWSEETVRALNSIDIAFNHSGQVREAWAELFQALDAKPNVGHVVDERIRKLLKEMAADLGLADTLRLDDFGRVYFPVALLEEREVRALERRATLERLKGIAAPTENAADPATGPAADLWPPTPE